MDVSHLLPVLDQIIVEIVDPPATDGGIILPYRDVSGPRYAKVIAVGPGRHSEYSAAMLPVPPCDVGDTVLMHSGAGTEHKVEGKAYRFILPRDLMAVVLMPPAIESTAP